MTWPNLMDSNSALCAKMVRPGMAVRKCPPLLDFAVALGCCTHDDVSSRIGYPWFAVSLWWLVLLVAQSNESKQRA